MSLVNHVWEALEDADEAGLTRRERYMLTAIEEFIADKINPLLTLRVKRSEAAKEFPLVHIKKSGDVGLDLPSIIPEGSTTIRPGCMVNISTGIYFEIPEGYWMAIEARSSTSQDLIVVPKGIIDEGYRGEMHAVLINVGQKSIQVNHGDRLVQAILRRRYTERLEIVEVNELAPSERGETGFGSTGKNG